MAIPDGIPSITFSSYHIFVRENHSNADSGNRNSTVGIHHLLTQRNESQPKLTSIESQRNFYFLPSSHCWLLAC